MARNLEPQHITLNGKRFRVNGPIRVTNITVPPNPIVFGDTEKQGQTQVLQQFVQSNNIGGSGRWIGNNRTDATRNWKSRVDTRWLDMLCLPPEVISMGRPGTIAPLTATKSYRGLQYFAFSNRVYYWADAGQFWVTVMEAITAITDMIVFKDMLYFAGTTWYHRRHSDGTLDSYNVSASSFTLWDNKLWKLYSHADGWMLAKSVDGVAWTDTAAMPGEVIPGRIQTFRDANGASVICCVTDQGLWLYDDAAPRWYSTEAYWLPAPTSQTPQSTAFRDGRLYCTTGFLGMVAIQPGNPLVITPVGLDQDDGVPAEDAGQIVALCSDINYIVAMIDATAGSDDADWLGADPWDAPGWEFYSGPMTLRFYFGGWHCLYEATVPMPPGKVMDISNSYGIRRLYFADSDAVRYIEMNQATYNPRHNPTRRFQVGPLQHQTPWWHYGTEGQAKLHGHFILEVDGCGNSDARVDVRIRTDFDEVATGTIVGMFGDGLHDIAVPVGNPVGLEGRFFQYVFDLYGDATEPMVTPKIRFYQTDTMRLLPATYGFGFRIDLTKPVDGRTPEAQLEELKALADPSQTAVFYDFSYQSSGNARTNLHFGRISSMNGVEYAGAKLRGQGEYQVAFTCPYREDSQVG